MQSTAAFVICAAYALTCAIQARLPGEQASYVFRHAQERQPILHQDMKHVTVLCVGHLPANANKCRRGDTWHHDKQIVLTV